MFGGRGNKMTETKIIKNQPNFVVHQPEKDFEAKHGVGGTHPIRKLTILNLPIIRRNEQLTHRRAPQTLRHSTCEGRERTAVAGEPSVGREAVPLHLCGSEDSEGQAAGGGGCCRKINTEIKPLLLWGKRSIKKIQNIRWNFTHSF